jgi:hypothetical protein
MGRAIMRTPLHGPWGLPKVILLKSRRSEPLLLGSPSPDVAIWRLTNMDSAKLLEVGIS